MQDSWIDDVLHFWFEELQPSQHFERDERVDAEIRARFEGLYEQLRKLEPSAHTSPQACLAAVIALDQLPRNMYRGSARAFQEDARALATSAYAIEHGFDRPLSALQRIFLYMPWQHAEDRAAQARSVQLFEQVGDAESLDFARQHKEIIDRFGRFPHRNAALGRETTNEEREFLKIHPGF